MAEARIKQISRSHCAVNDFCNPRRPCRLPGSPSVALKRSELNFSLRFHSPLPIRRDYTSPRDDSLQSRSANSKQFRCPRTVDTAVGRTAARCHAGSPTGATEAEIASAGARVAAPGEMSDSRDRSLRYLTREAPFKSVRGLANRGRVAARRDRPCPASASQCDRVYGRS